MVAAEVAQFDHMSRGRFMLGVGPGGLLSDFELFGHTDVAVRNRKVIESVDIMQRIWAQDPPYEIDGEFWKFSLKTNVIAELGIGYMPKPYQKGGPPVTFVAGQPELLVGAHRGAAGLGHHFGQYLPTYSMASHWAIYSKACAELGKKPSGENWRVARNIMVAPSDAEAHDRAFGEKSSNRYFWTYIRAALSGVGLLSILKPRPDMTDEETTVEAITEGCILYGSPKTMLDKLVAFRDEVGPFGSLLMTGLDWGGPNEAWERQAMTLMAEQVMPKFHQHVGAQAAE